MNGCNQDKRDIDMFTASTYVCAIFTEDLLYIKGRYIQWIFIFDGNSLFFRKAYVCQHIYQMTVRQKYINLKNLGLLLSHDLFAQVKLIQKTHRKIPKLARQHLHELVALVVLLTYNTQLCCWDVWACVLWVASWTVVIHLYTPTHMTLKCVCKSVCLGLKVWSMATEKRPTNWPRTMSKSQLEPAKPNFYLWHYWKNLKNSGIDYLLN